MNWYEGGIVEAVTVSRTNNSIFVVYIEGDNEKSKQMTQLINNPDVSKVLEGSNFTAIKVEANSVTHTQFSEIYKQTPVPSVYFIGKNGAAIRIVTEVHTPIGMLIAMNEIIAENGGTPVEITENMLIQEASGTDVVCEGDVCRVPSKAESSTEDLDKKIGEDKPAINDTEEACTQIGIEDKLKLAQEMIEMKRIQKEAEEKEQWYEMKRAEKEAEKKEKEKLQEIERRKLGHDVQKMKRWQHDQEIKQMMEERQRERREDLEAREKVRRQIEEDKREKAARNKSSSLPSTAVSSDAAPRQSSQTNNSVNARLQFRLPDGSTNTKDFPRSTVLQEVVDYVKENVQLTFSNFVLSTTFPRREFTANDYSQTLADLELVPTAVILILPIQHGAVATNNEAGFMAMMWHLLAPILNFLGYLKSFVIKPRTPTPAGSVPSDMKRTNDQEVGESSRSKRRAGEAVIRKQGNIYRLTDQDSDEDNNTWNGNSTQQM